MDRNSPKLININQSQASIKRSRIKVLRSLVDKKETPAKMKCSYHAVILP